MRVALTVAFAACRCCSHRRRCWSIVDVNSVSVVVARVVIVCVVLGALPVVPPRLFVTLEVPALLRLSRTIRRGSLSSRALLPSSFYSMRFIIARAPTAGDRIGIIPTSVNGIRTGDGGEDAALSSPDASPPRCQRREHDAGEPEGLETPGRLSSTVSAEVGAVAAAAAASAGEDGDGDGGFGAGGYHYDGGMDQSSYHFSEDAISVEGAAEGSHSPMGAGEVGGRGRGGAYGEADTAAAAAATAAGRVSSSLGAAGNDGDGGGDEKGETEDPGPEYRRDFSGEGEGGTEGVLDIAREGVGRTRRQGDGDADGGLGRDGTGGVGGGSGGGDGGAVGDDSGGGLGVRQEATTVR